MNDIKFYAGSKLFGLLYEYYNYFIGTRKSNKSFVNHRSHKYPELHDRLKRILSSDGISTDVCSGTLKTVKYTNYYE